MNDEVSVAELLEREGWGGPARKSNGRMRMTAVMLAVVLGCGLAALLVHFGSKEPQADSPSVFNLPHPPTGGLAGGGVAVTPSGSEVTATNKTIVVTNQAPGAVGAGINEIPRTHRAGESETQTVTVTDSATPGHDDSTAGPSVTTTPTSSSQPSNSTSKTSSTAQPKPSCLLVICW
ncbi:hypothetical protein [Amycolatopsis pithecellobii]|uniref:Uncharacterized protein n=1 Tax=Amycolatopsis pithecellobii TaxID=664692 RepID=A0A6N7Z756_9PSEU|nr:hypothetical protein [Amycolatopsis pithecellobii]MTD56971.1 hypothetical protein [Amycolatopsis pithecellobii]